MIAQSNFTNPRDLIATYNHENFAQFNVHAPFINLTQSWAIRLIDGRRPLGLDLATRKFQVCYQDDRGAIIDKCITKAELIELLNGFCDTPLLIGIEGCSGASYWKHFAEQRGHTVRVMPGSMTKKFTRRKNKDDVIDAYAIYLSLFIPVVPECQTRTEEQLAISALIGEKETLLKTLNTQINKVRSLMIETGEYELTIRDANSALTAVNSYLKEHRDEQGAHNYTVLAMRKFKDTIIFLSKQIDEINNVFSQYVRSNTAARELLTVPGVGPSTAVAILTGAPDLSRFESARQFQAYFGLTTRHSGSGGKIVQGRMALNGNPAVKRLLYQGALSLISNDYGNPAARSTWLDDVIFKNRHSFKKAPIKISGKILRICYGVLKSGKPYDPMINGSLGKPKVKLHLKNNANYKKPDCDALLQQAYYDEVSGTWEKA